MLTDCHYGKKLVSALTNETRIEIVRVLSSGQRFVGELEQLFPVCKEVLMQHLEILVGVNLIKVNTVDSFVFYSIHSSSINIVQNFLINKGPRREVR
jgi:predicted transcriptional regulator